LNDDDDDEFEDDDIDEPMKTMVKEPYVHHVPVLTGGNGYNGVETMAYLIYIQIDLSVRCLMIQRLYGFLDSWSKIKHEAGDRYALIVRSIKENCKIFFGK